MSRWQKISLWLASLAVAAFAAYLWLAREQPEVAERLVSRLPPSVTGLDLRPAATPAADATTAASSPAAPPPELVDPALPSLGNSDTELAQALAALPGGEPALALVVRRELIRRFVATVDQLPGQKLAVKNRLWAPLPGAFSVEDIDGQPRPAMVNQLRYQPLVAAFLAIDPAAAVQLYRRWYPLVQAAYAESAGGGRLFQARMLTVLDHLLAVKLPKAAPALVLAEGRYRFADPALEQMSVGAKALLRLGAEESGKVQQRLAEYRALLAAPAG